MNRKDIQAELQQELSMRRKVWNNAHDKTGALVFHSSIHQRRYDTLQALSELLDEMTPGEWLQLIARRQAAKNRPQTTATVQTLFPEA